MKRYLQHIIILLIMSISICSCSWLDVGSKSEEDEDDMFSSADGYYTALTGIYINIGNTNLYGGNLPLYVMEPLSQQYTVSDDAPDRKEWVQFNYTTDEGETLINGIWLTFYNTIVNCNMLLQKLDEEGADILDNDVRNILKGETLGLRALLYFDLIRIFNQSYTLNPESNNVPYKTDFGFKIGEKLTTEEILERLIVDLQESRSLLVVDPFYTGKDYSNRYMCYTRIERMNYYAVIALMARIELYRENYQVAAEYAMEVINSNKFSFISSDDILQTDNYGVELKADRIFEPEMIFALYTENILSISKSYYEGLSQDFVKSTNIYDGGDVRHNWFFTNPSANGEINFIRYQRSSANTDSGVYGDPIVPILKLSEMYLIAAECARRGISNLDAVELINTIKKARKASEMSPTISEREIDKEITREYICDFKGEGQLFYYYKRKNMVNVDDGNYKGNTITIPTSAYTLPLPENEIQFGYGQK